MQLSFDILLRLQNLKPPGVGASGQLPLVDNHSIGSLLFSGNLEGGKERAGTQPIFRVFIKSETCKKWVLF